MNLPLSERIAWNVADRYILRCVGFPIERIEEFDEVFMQMEDSLFIHVCSLVEPISLEQDDYSELILPKVKLVELQLEIDTYFADESLQAKQTLETIISQYLWSHCNRLLSDIKYSYRYNDPLLGLFFRALGQTNNNGLFGGTGILE